MLVLTRDVGQRVRLRFNGPEGPIDVWVTMHPARGSGGKIGRQLGFDAPRAVSIQREENLPENERYGATVGEGR